MLLAFLYQEKFLSDMLLKFEENLYLCFMSESIYIT